MQDDNQYPRPRDGAFFMVPGPPGGTGLAVL